MFFNESTSSFGHCFAFTFVDVSFSGYPYSKFKKLISTKTILIIMFTFDLLKVDSNEKPIDILRSKTLVDDVPLVAGFAILQPCYWWVVCGNGAQVLKLILQWYKVLSQHLMRICQIIFVFDEFECLNIILIKTKRLVACLLCVNMKLREDAVLFGEVTDLSYFLDLFVGYFHCAEI